MLLPAATSSEKKDTLEAFFSSDPAPITNIPVVKGVHKGKVCNFLCKTKKWELG